MKLIQRSGILAIILMVLMAISVVAVTTISTAPLIISETAGTTYASSTPFSVLVNNNNLVSQGFMTPTGLDAQVFNGSISLPRMIVGDRTNFVMPSLPANTSQTLTYQMGNTPTADMPIVPGYNGYVTTSNNAALQPGNNFLIDANAYVNTAAGAGKNIVNKASAMVIDGGTTTAGNITATGTITTAGVQIAQYVNNAIDGQVGGGFAQGQSFTVVQSFYMSEVDVYSGPTFGALPGGNITMGIYATSAGLPTGSALATATIASGSWVASGEDSYTFTPLLLSAGVMYAYTLTFPAGDASHFVTPLVTNQKPYRGGTYIHSADGGTTWFTSAIYDNEFDIVGTLAPIFSESAATGVHDTQVSMVPNLLTNSSFELGHLTNGMLNYGFETDSLASWTTSLGGGTATVGTSNPHSGTYQLQVVNATNAATEVYQTPNSVPPYNTFVNGQSYILEGWIRTASANLGYLIVYTGSGGGFLTAGPCPPDNQWHLFSVGFTIVDAATANCGFVNDPGSSQPAGAVVYDDAELVGTTSTPGWALTYQSGSTGVVSQSTEQTKYGYNSLALATGGVSNLVYSAQVVTLSANTTYTFGAWVWSSVPTVGNLQLQYINGTSVVFTSSTHPGDSQWHFLTVTGESNNSTSAQVGLVMGAGYNTVDYMDGAILAVGNNFIANGSMEYGNPPTGWTLFQSGSGTSMSQSGAHAVFGTYSMAVATTTSSGVVFAYAGDTTGISVGQTYTYGAWIWSSVPNNVQVHWQDSGTGQYLSSFHPGDSQWHFLTATGIVTAGGTTDILGGCITYSAVNATFYMDGAILALGATIPGLWSNNWDFLPNQYNNLNLALDGSMGLLPGTYMAVDGSNTIASNSNNWIFDQNNVCSYLNSYTEQVNGVEVINYDVKTIISGTVLPNNDSAGSYPGAFTFGNNPAGVTTALGNLVGTATVGVTPSAGPAGADVVQNTIGGNVSNFNPGGGTTGPGSWIDPVVTNLVNQYNQPGTNPDGSPKPYQGTQVSIQQAWMIIGLAVVICSIPVSVAAGSMAITLFVILGVIAALCSQGIFVWAVFYVSAIIMAALYVLLIHRTSGGAV